MITGFKPAFPLVEAACRATDGITEICDRERRVFELSETLLPKLAFGDAGTMHRPQASDVQGNDWGGPKTPRYSKPSRFYPK